MMMVAHDDSHDDACCGDCTGGNGGTATAMTVLIKYDDLGFFITGHSKISSTLGGCWGARGDT